jgi:hypothetical protein
MKDNDVVGTFQQSHSLYKPYKPVSNAAANEFSSGSDMAPAATDGLNMVDYSGINQKSYDAIMGDKTGKYAGAVPAKVVAPEAAAPAVAPAAATPTTSAPSENMKDLKNLGAEAANQFVGTMQAKGNLKRNEYENDVKYFLEQGKYWFDKEQDLRPDIDKYMAMAPSAKESLQSSTLTGGKANDAVKWSQGPINQLVEKALTAGGNKDWEGVGEYTTNKALEGAVQGFMTNGWKGAVAGAVLQTVMAAFTYGGAIEEDKKNEEVWRQKAEQDLRDWTVARNRRIVANQNAAKEKQKSAVAANKNEKKLDSDMKRVRMIASRDAMKNMLTNAGSISLSRRNARLQRLGGMRNAA